MEEWKKSYTKLKLNFIFRFANKKVSTIHDFNVFICNLYIKPIFELNVHKTQITDSSHNHYLKADTKQHKILQQNLFCACFEGYVPFWTFSLPRGLEGWSQH